jgi:hypothetical protein
MRNLFNRSSGGEAARAGGSGRLFFAALFAALAIGLVPEARADFTLNFETTPALPTQPNNFIAAGPKQTYSVAGVWSITGGVVLGNPTFLPQFASHGSAPNLYGTTDIADPSLLNTITLTIDPSQNASKVTGVLFNGQDTVASGTTESYVVTAFSGATQVASSPFSLSTTLSSASSLTNFSLSSATLPITSVTITTPNAGVNGWDFLVDNITVTTSAVPEPASLLLMAIGGGGVLGAARRRRRAARA